MTVTCSKGSLCLRVLIQPLCEVRHKIEILIKSNKHARRRVLLVWIQSWEKNDIWEICSRSQHRRYCILIVSRINKCPVYCDVCILLDFLDDWSLSEVNSCIVRILSKNAEMLTIQICNRSITIIDEIAGSCLHFGLFLSGLCEYN